MFLFDVLQCDKHYRKNKCRGGVIWIRKAGEKEFAILNKMVWSLTEVTHKKTFHGVVWDKQVGEEGYNTHIEVLPSVKTLRIQSDWNVWVT